MFSHRTSVTTGWDGKTKGGNDAEDGVYYYIIEATGFDDNVKTVTGFVQLIRG
ncbi:MAG: hypothetical protein FD123_294 [Bacteroidetes bacterium]|nr:MAG: hypothetical protein FD123_294 [Bacteroidota bacterium]